MKRHLESLPTLWSVYIFINQTTLFDNSIVLSAGILKLKIISQNTYLCEYVYLNSYNHKQLLTICSTVSRILEIMSQLANFHQDLKFIFRRNEKN